MFFRKKRPYRHPPPQRGTILYEKKGSGGVIPIHEFEKLSGAAFISELDFIDESVHSAVREKIAKLRAKERLSREQIWLGSYFHREIESNFLPEVSIRWIDDDLGWGVFAEKAFQKMDFIAEYSGLIRKSKRSDRKNGYCFEYLYAPGIPSKFTIDAENQSGIARFINHSSKPNLDGSIATYDGMNHVVLFAKEPIAKGTQLTYDYGPVYWSRREKPRAL